MLLILRSKKKLSEKAGKFNEKLSSHLKRAGINFSFSSFEDIEIFIETSKINLFIDGKPLENWKTIYPRKVGKYRILAFILADLSKKNKLFFIDRFLENSSSTTKIVQMFKFAQNKIPIPKTYYTTTYSRKQLSSAVKFLGFPVVIKKCNTSQGSGVYLAKNISELNKSIKALLKSKDNGSIFLQEFIPNDFEYRIFVTGNKIGAAEKKIRTNKNEFRNNVHLGAKEEFIEIASVKKNILNLALKASCISNIQVSGVDIVEANGRIVVFEANSCPGLTLDEKISPELNSLAKYLEECEKK
jgi:ribosomal protein S6--L-glutamate ligase